MAAIFPRVPDSLYAVYVKSDFRFEDGPGISIYGCNFQLVLMFVTRHLCRTKETDHENPWREARVL